MQFPYPGDEPSALLSTVWAIERAEQQLEAFDRTVQTSQSHLTEIWEGDVAARVATDLHKMGVAVPQLRSRLAEARAALDSYRSTLMGIRTEIDALRKQHQNVSEVLAGEDYEYQNAATRYDLAGGPGDDLDSYRAGLAESREQTARRLESLTDMYDALVLRSVQAAELCQATVRLDSLAPGEPGGRRQGLAQGYGLDQFAVAHLEDMRGQAGAFVEAAEQIRRSSAAPAECGDLISAMATTQFGASLADPDFTATVTALGGAGDLP